MFNIGLACCGEGVEVCLEGGHVMVPSLTCCSALAVVVSLNGNQIVVEVGSEDSQLLVMECLGFGVGLQDGFALCIVMKAICTMVNPINNMQVGDKGGWG